MWAYGLTQLNSVCFGSALHSFQLFLCCVCNFLLSTEALHSYKPVPNVFQSRKALRECIPLQRLYNPLKGKCPELCRHMVIDSIWFRSALNINAIILHTFPTCLSLCMSLVVVDIVILISNFDLWSEFPQNSLNFPSVKGIAWHFGEQAHLISSWDLNEKIDTTGATASRQLA